MEGFLSKGSTAGNWRGEPLVSCGVGLQLSVLYQLSKPTQRRSSSVGMQQDRELKSTKGSHDNSLPESGTVSP